ncbi:unnamed protein product, partial [Prunus brigantina]
MNGSCLQSITTPKKACKNIENDRGLTGLAWWSLIGASMGVRSAFGIVKHGGVTPMNLGKSRP